MSRPDDHRPGESRSDSGDESSPGTASTSVSCSNQAFILAVAAWSGLRPLSFRDHPDARLSPELRREIKPVLDHLRDSAEAIIEPAEALDRLKRAHRAESRPDLDRVHPSWWLRALREEPRSVRAVVARYGPERVRRMLRQGIEPLPDEAMMDRPIPPDILGLVLTLWRERLVGDIPERDDDPLAIAALTRLAPGSAYRLGRMTGLVKLALAGGASQDFPSHRPTPGDSRRIAGFRRFFTPIEPSVRELALRDLRRTAGRPEVPITTSRWLGLVGLTTIGRLLSTCEPYRVRWALQHVPYPVAKRIRNQMPRKETPSKAVVALENLILAAAWRSLEDEGKIVPPRDRGPLTTAGSTPP